MADNPTAPLPSRPFGDCPICHLNDRMCECHRRRPAPVPDTANRLPEEWVKKQLEGDGKYPMVSVFMGVPLNDMTRDELMAVAIAGWKEHQQLLDSSLARSRRRIELMLEEARR